MYILIKENIPLGHQVNCAAHAALGCYLRFQDHPEVQDWLKNSFRKVTCKVSEREFEQAKQYPDSVIITESALDGQEVAIAFRPRAEWPKAFEFFRLFR